MIELEFFANALQEDLANLGISVTTSPVLMRRNWIRLDNEEFDLQIFVKPPIHGKGAFIEIPRTPYTKIPDA